MNKKIFFLLIIFSLNLYAADTKIEFKNPSFEAQQTAVSDGLWKPDVNDWYGGAGVFNPTSKIIQPETVDGKLAAFIDSGKYLAQVLFDDKGSEIKLGENQTFSFTFNTGLRSDYGANISFAAQIWANGAMIAEKVIDVNQTAGTWAARTISIELIDNLKSLGNQASFAIYNRSEGQLLIDNIKGTVAAEFEIDNKLNIQPKYKVAGKKIGLLLSEDGKIVSIEFPHKKYLGGQTAIRGCQIDSNVVSKTFEDGSIEFTKHLTSPDKTEKCRVTEKFIPENNAVRWDIVIEATGKAWTAPIESIFSFDSNNIQYWSAWADGRKAEEAKGWADPLKPVKMNSRVFRYGGESHYDIDAISIPIITIIDANNSTGLSFAQSPEDIIIEMYFKIQRNGKIVFSRRNSKISPDKPVKFTMYIKAHEADWRGGLGWYVDKFKKYFDPPNKKVEEVAGCGAYSAFQGEIDAHKYLRMNYRFNWNAVFDWPYIGMLIPPLSDANEQWISNRGEKTSIAQMENYCRTMREKGFHVLSYFGNYDFGKNLEKTKIPERQAKDDKDLWRNANDFAYYKLRDALLLADKDYEWGRKGTPYAGWEGGTLMDPAVKSLSDHLVEQIKWHIEKIPSSSGITIDRLDYVRLYNHYAQDDYTLIGDKEVRSLLISWYDIMSKIGPMMHKADKVILCNPLCRRIDMLEHIDGIYDEYGEIPLSLNICSFMALRKPIIAWTNAINDPSPDEFMQRHLYMGSYVTVPYPRNDHTINPKEAWVDQYYDDYGLLLAALKGKEWYLKPGVIKIDSPKAIANIFKVPSGYVIPIMLGSEKEKVSITLDGLDWPDDCNEFFARVIYPGDEDYTKINYTKKDRAIVIDVPLKRGCALVRLEHTIISPVGYCFFDSVSPDVQTKIKESSIRFTLDGQEPSADSSIWEMSNLKKSAMLKFAAFDSSGKKLTETITKEFIKVVPMAPVIMPDSKQFSDVVDALISMPAEFNDCVIRYTTDSTDPTETSPAYTGNITLKDSTTLKARAYIGTKAGAIAIARFGKKPQRPQKPDVYISDLKPIKATAGWGIVQADRSIDGNPISILGEKFEKGMGVHSPSILEYNVKEDYEQFVSIVGIDDEVRNQNSGRSIVFKVYALDRIDLSPQAVEAIGELPGTTLLYETPVIREGNVWHINVDIPDGTKIMRLVATDGGDDNYYDHADWAQAGFIVKDRN